MVTTRKRIGISDIEVILKKHGIKEKDKVVEELKLLPRSREKAPPPPPNGICLRKAAEKYGISESTLSRAANRGDIPIKARTKNWLYVDEVALMKYFGKD